MMMTENVERQDQTPSSRACRPLTQRIANSWTLNMATVPSAQDVSSSSSSSATEGSGKKPLVRDFGTHRVRGGRIADMAAVYVDTEGVQDIPRVKSAEEKRSKAGRDVRVRPRSQCISVASREELFRRPLSQQFTAIVHTPHLCGSGEVLIQQSREKFLQPAGDLSSPLPSEQQPLNTSTVENDEQVSTPAAADAAKGDPTKRGSYINRVDADVQKLHNIIKRGDLGQFRKQMKVMMKSDKGSVDVLHVKNRGGNTPLHTATECGNLEVVKYLLKQGAKPDVTDSLGWTPLLAACKAGELAAAKILLTTGSADANAKTDDLNTPLHYLVIKPPKPEDRDLYYEVMTCLLGKEGKVYGKVSNNTSARNKNGDTPLHYAALHSSSEVVKWLVEHHAPVNHQNTYGDTALHCAARRGDAGVVETLLRHGASKSLTGRSGTAQDMIRELHPTNAALLALLT